MKSNIRYHLIEHFSKQKEVYSKKRALQEPTVSWLLQVPKNGSFRILDVGCGDGSLLQLIALKRPKLSTVGIDLCRALIKTGQERVKHGSPANGDINFIVADALHLPFRSDVFDSSYAVTVLHHVYGYTLSESRRMQQFVLKEISRVTKSLFFRLVNYVQAKNWAHF